MANLYLMVGIPGSGKTTWVQNHLDKFDKHISRDDIRFSMLKEGEDYFSREKEVFKEYCSQINRWLSNGFNVFADATHINKASRAKIIKEIKGYHELNCIVVENSLFVTVRQNEQRTGLKYVPKSVIYRMSEQFEFPSYEEGFKNIFRVSQDRLERIVYRKEDL